MNKEDKLVLGTLAGVNLILSPEHYDKYKGTLQDQLEEAYKEIDKLNNIRVKAIELIKDNGCYEEDTKTFCQDINTTELKELLNILELKEGDKE